MNKHKNQPRVQRQLPFLGSFCGGYPSQCRDCHLLPDLIHGREIRVWGDQVYRGQRKMIIEHGPRAKDFANRRYRRNGFVDEAERAKNRTV